MMLPKIDRDSPVPLHAQLSTAVRESILSGRLEPGSAITSTRELAKELKISRFTVRRAYEDLISQGYLKTTRGGNCCVVERLPGDVATMMRVERDSSFDISLTPLGCFAAQHNSDSLAAEFSSAGFDYCRPALDQLPLSTWRQLSTAAGRFDQWSSSDDSHTHPFGNETLRDAIASYLKRSRAYSCNADQIAIFSGSYPLDVITRILADAGETVACDDPSYSGARRIFKAHGLRVSAVPQDEHGMRTDLLAELSPPPVLIYVTPSRHEPTGSVMSLDRRRDLIDYARKTGAFIIEDDYESEFVHPGNLQPAIAALDGESVIYLQSFWKVLGNLTKLNFIVVPPRLVDVFYRAKKLLDRGLPLLEQRSLAAFLNQGHFERSVKRLRTVYARRGKMLLESVSRELTGYLCRQPMVSAMHILVQFHPGLKPTDIEQAAVKSGLPLVETATYYEAGHRQGEYLIPFAQLEEESIDSLCQQFSRYLHAKTIQSSI